MLSSIIYNTDLSPHLLHLLDGDIDKAAEDLKRFDKKLIALRRELESGKKVSEHESQYKKYFDTTTKQKRGTKATIKEDKVKAAKRYYGYLALITNEAMDAITALEIYRNKDLVEVTFGNLKERLNVRRAPVSSEQSLDGKLLIEFIALIYLSYIKKQMQDANLFKDLRFKVFWISWMSLNALKNRIRSYALEKCLKNKSISTTT